MHYTWSYKNAFYSALVSRLRSLASSRSISPYPDSETCLNLSSMKENKSVVVDGHEDLHLDRRKLMRALEVVNAENLFWVRSGWWAGGVGPGTLEV